MTYKKRKIDTLPSIRELNEFENKIFDVSTKEGEMQKLISKHPNLLLPLEISEFVRHLRYPTRNIKNPSAPQNNKSNRIPDFDGISLEGLAYPVIVEAKGPNENIIENDGSLSKKSLEVIDQVTSAVFHMLRPEGQDIRTKVFEKPLGEILENDLLEDFNNLDNYTVTDVRNSVIISIMENLIEFGCGLIALIGLTIEFKNNPNLLINSRESYLKKGVILLTYDELLVMNRVIRDYFLSHQSIYSFFNNASWSKMSDSTIVRQDASLVFTDELKKALQEKIYSVSSNVCFFGFGSPPQPTRTGEKEWAVLEVGDSFNIGMLWANPTYLKGVERLLWAGKYLDKWIVIKERLTEPLKEGVVWYIFQPPSEREPVIQ